jgi:hypothetical protein
MSQIDLADPPALLPWNPRTEDVLLERTPCWNGDFMGRVNHTCRTNIPQELWLWDGVGFGWGTLSPSSYTLALCILDHFLGWHPEATCVQWHYPLPCDSLAYLWTPAFARNYVAKVPYWGGTISGASVRQYLAVAGGLLMDGRGGVRGRTLRQLYPAHYSHLQRSE